jgi:hypothetical protein
MKRFAPVDDWHAFGGWPGGGVSVDEHRDLVT